MNPTHRHESLLQLLKFGAVGVLNTGLTALVIWLALSLLGASQVVANVWGYTAGLLNSFLWNSRWTFSRAYSWRRFALFLGVFVVCYLLQLGTLLWLDTHTTVGLHVEGWISRHWTGDWVSHTSGFTHQLLAMLVYNIANFLLNKFVTFAR